MKDYYRILGIKKEASLEEIKSTFRKLALKYHPDKTNESKSKEIFLLIKEAYQVLSDPQERGRYDVAHHIKQKINHKKTYSSAKPSPSPPQHPSSPPPKHQQVSHSKSDYKDKTQEEFVSEKVKQEEFNHFYAHSKDVSSLDTNKDSESDLKKINELIIQHQYIEAEMDARELLKSDPFNEKIYSVLGDIEKARGNLKEAANSYIYAAQMAPQKHAFQEKHAQLIKEIEKNQYAKKAFQKNVKTQKNSQKTKFIYNLKFKFNPYQRKVFLRGIILLVLACIYLIFSNEPPILPFLRLISTWTLGLASMMIVGGVCTGVVLSLCGYLDDFNLYDYWPQSYPDLKHFLNLLSVIQFWMGSTFYFIAKKNEHQVPLNIVSLNYGVIFTTLLIAFATYFNPNISFIQTFLWGGNVIYISALIGWIITESCKKKILREK